MFWFRTFVYIALGQQRLFWSVFAHHRVTDDAFRFDASCLSLEPLVRQWFFIPGMPFGRPEIPPFGADYWT